MQVLVAKHSGFCEGVERAFRIAQETAIQGGTVYMLGNLVHNKQVVNKLKEKGVISVASLTEIPPANTGILLISAHGVGPDIYKEAEAKGLKIIDTTCPWVKKAQKIAGDLAAKGCLVIIFGDVGHAEVAGLVGWSRGQALIIQTINEANDLRLDPAKQLGLIAQTTQSEELFKQIAAALNKRFPSLEIHDTICGATSKRQEAAIDLAKQVDLMIIIGDQLSANTKRLTELCTRTGTKTYQIETVNDLKHDWLKSVNKIGITAGASTPEWIVQEVIRGLQSAH
jgi:4-hydroxy-3-methylbut-2-enyl diphosphate reductase